MKYLGHKKRDLLNKGFRKNIQGLPFLYSILIESRTKGAENHQLYLRACYLALIAEENPYLIRISNSKDKKLIGTFTGCKIQLKHQKLSDFVLQLSQKTFFTIKKKMSGKTFTADLDHTLFEELKSFFGLNIQQVKLHVNFNFSKNLPLSEASLLFSLWNLNDFA